MAVRAGCRAACLYKAGRGAFSNVQAGRIRKTEYYRDNPGGFVVDLILDIEREQRKARRKGYQLAVRLNGTSDIFWEQYGIFQRFPDVQFYDYTKNFNARRLARIDRIPNYHITVSYSQTSPQYARKVIGQTAANIAAVFSAQAFAALGSHYALPGGRMLPVLNGDITDERFLDPDDQQYLVALVAKGPAAKNDETGFVIREVKNLAVAI
tara:strand:+ start:578 stop:1207 length:630 start_codon:yes stop_codon:yes gene_type:complete